ncbi:YveK family protein [Lactobacillus delbrueckii]|uniref:YveK family protein n=2 Tax=Lactobacillus delbrueckii TaxID=1584 RepID=UPI0003065CE9|nr:Wzz/FepE/Etk N-terminal domain-containing protein [Lactobacillus delbrueckii]
MNNSYSMADTTLTLKELAKLIWKNLLLIVIVTALFGGLAYGTANYLLPARYTASMDFVAKGKITQGGFTKWQARSQNEQAANVFQNIAISPGVIDHTTNEIGNVSPEALRKNITVCSTPRSNTYTLTVTSSSPEKAKKKLEVVAKNFKKEFKLEYKQGRKAMPTKKKRRMYLKPILPTVLVKSIKFKDKTRVVKSYPNVKFAAAIGTATGFLLATWGSIYWRLRRSYR